MWYAIMATDVADSLDKRKAVRERHLERLRALQADGRLLVAGPHPNIDAEDAGESGFSGSLIIAEFADLENATNWANADPYREAGVYDSVTVKPFKRVFP